MLKCLQKAVRHAGLLNFLGDQYIYSTALFYYSQMSHDFYPHGHKMALFYFPLSHPDMSVEVMYDMI